MNKTMQYAIDQAHEQFGRRLAGTMNGTPELDMSRVWVEYDSAAEWCAKRKLKGTYGDPLPSFISSECWYEIKRDVEAFERRVRETAYAISMTAR